MAFKIRVQRYSDGKIESVKYLDGNFENLEACRKAIPLRSWKNTEKIYAINVGGLTIDVYHFEEVT
jgi:hypothetical protein